MNTKTASVIIGFIFIVVGILGFIPNPIIGESEGAIFHSDTMHNMVHIISGALFFIIGLAMPGFARTFLIIFGIVYFLIGILGLSSIGNEPTTTVLGFLHVNGPDNYLHIALGIVIFLASMLRPSA